MNRYGKLRSDVDAEPAVREVIERFRRGWENLDLEQILSTIARKDDMVMYGTDLIERWVGYDSLVEPTRAMTEAFQNPVYRWGSGEPFLWVRGDVGWACGDLTIQFALAGDQHTTVMRTSIVVVRDNGDWKIAHAHFSIGQETPVADYGNG